MYIMSFPYLLRKLETRDVLFIPSFLCGPSVTRIYVWAYVCLCDASVPAVIMFSLDIRSLEFLATERRCTVFPVRYELNVYMLLAVPGHALLWPFPVTD
jgi:hypothetical protein